MAGNRVSLPRAQVLDANSRVQPGAKLFVWRNTTTTLVELCVDRACTTPGSATNPLIADSAGRLNLPYTTYGGMVTLCLKDANDNVLWTEDDQSLHYERDTPFVDLASAGTMDLGSVVSDKIRITGTTTITSFGSAPAGVSKELRFAAALTLTYNASSMILTGQQSITTAANDKATAISLGSGNWYVVYSPASKAGWRDLIGVSSASQLFFVEDYGAVGDGATDDVTAIQDAIDAAYAAGGGTVLLDGDDYAISTRIRVKAGVHLVGVGAGQYPLPGQHASTNYRAQNKTRLVAKAGFPAGFAMVDVSTDANAAYCLQAARVRGILIDCDGVANYGLLSMSVKWCNFENIGVLRPLIYGIMEDCLVHTHTGTALAGSSSTITLATTASSRNSLYNNKTISITGGTGSGQSRTISAYIGSTGVATVSVNWTTPPDATSTYSIAGDAVTDSNSDNQFNTWSDIWVWAGSTGSAVCWRQIGNPTADVCQNQYNRVMLVGADGDCLVIANADTNDWFKLETYSFGTGVGVRCLGNSRNTIEAGRHNTFHSVQCAGAGTGGFVVEAGTGASAHDNVVLHYSTGNGAPNPTIGADVRFWFVASPSNNAAQTDWMSWTPVVTFATVGDLSVSYALQSGRIRRQGKLVEYEVWLQFTPTFTTASGEFRITGLPYQAANVGANYGSVVHGTNSAVSFGASKTSLAGVIENGATQVKVIALGSAAANAYLTAAELATGSAKIIRISGRYECAF